MGGIYTHIDCSNLTEQKCIYIIIYIIYTYTYIYIYIDR